MSELSSLYKNLAGTTSQDITNTSSSVLESILLLKKIWTNILNVFLI